MPHENPVSAVIVVTQSVVVRYEERVIEKVNLSAAANMVYKVTPVVL